jgi:hypothetical protein
MRPRGFTLTALDSARFGTTLALPRFQPEKSTRIVVANAIHFLGGTPHMRKFTRAAGACIAVASLSFVATPAHASTAAASIATSKSVVSDLPVQTEMSTRFKPYRCDERRYFRKHERKCVRFWVRESERFDRDWRDDDRRDRRDRRDRFDDRRDNDRRFDDRLADDRRDPRPVPDDDRRP